MTPPGPWKSYCTLVRWDWTREMRRKTTLLSMGVMGLITLFLFSFAIPPEREVLLDTRAGILWVTFLFAATIGIDRAFRADGRSGMLQGLLLAPVRRATLFYARVTSTFVFVVGLQLVLGVLFLVLFNQSLNVDGAITLIATVIATDLGFVTVGVMIGAMTWSVPGGDVLLRILLFPMLLPVFNVAVASADRAFKGQALSTTQLLMLAAFDLTFLGAGHLLFEHLVKDVGSDV